METPPQGYTGKSSARGGGGTRPRQQDNRPDDRRAGLHLVAPPSPEYTGTSKARTLGAAPRVAPGVSPSPGRCTAAGSVAWARSGQHDQHPDGRDGRELRLVPPSPLEKAGKASEASEASETSAGSGAAYGAGTRRRRCQQDQRPNDGGGGL